MLLSCFNKVYLYSIFPIRNGNKSIYDKGMEMYILRYGRGAFTAIYFSVILLYLTQQSIKREGTQHADKKQQAGRTA